MVSPIPQTSPQHASAQYVFSIHPAISAQPDLIEEMNLLKNILDSYKKNSDKLSVKILSWGTSALKQIDSPLTLKQQCKELKRIFVHPIDGAMLEYPVICLDLVCEREDFAGFNFSSCGKTHYLAVSLLNWMSANLDPSFMSNGRNKNSQERRLQTNFIKSLPHVLFGINKSLPADFSLKDAIANNTPEVMKTFKKILEHERKPFTLEKIKLFIESGLVLTPKVLTDAGISSGPPKMPSDPYSGIPLQHIKFVIPEDIKKYLNEVMAQALYSRAEKTFTASQVNKECYPYLLKFTHITDMVRINLQTSVLVPNEITNPVSSFLSLEFKVNGWDFWEEVD